MTLSIIIPIYNVAPYIERCFDSIYSNCVDTDSFEVIAINDGSQDNSLEILDKLSERHSNLIIINKKNAGVSLARNDGIDFAKGKYIMFVDPDDIVVNSCIIDICNISNSHDADWVIFNSIDAKGKIVYNWESCFSSEHLYNSSEILHHGYIRGSVGGGIYRREFLISNSIRFLPNMKNGEDTHFNFLVLFHSNSICFHSLIVYQIVGREGSASTVFNVQRITSRISSLKKIEKQVSVLNQETKGNHDVIQFMMYSQIANLVSDCIKTKGLGIRFLYKNGVNKLYKCDVNGKIPFLLNKRYLLRYSFFLFYILSWTSHKLGYGLS